MQRSGSAEMRSKSYIARWKNFLNFLTQMFDTSSIVALAGNVEYNRSWGFETLTYPPTKNYNSKRNNQADTRPQFWLYCVIGRLFLLKWKKKLKFTIIFVNQKNVLNILNGVLEWEALALVVS